MASEDDSGRNSVSNIDVSRRNVRADPSIERPPSIYEIETSVTAQEMELLKRQARLLYSSREVRERTVELRRRRYSMFLISSLTLLLVVTFATVPVAIARMGIDVPLFDPVPAIILSVIVGLGLLEFQIGKARSASRALDHILQALDSYDADQNRTRLQTLGQQLDAPGPSI